MPYFLFLIWSVLPFSLNSFHDIPLAQFNLKVIGTDIEVRMLFDQNDWDMIVTSMYNDTPNADLHHAYIIQHSAWKVNQQITKLEICSSEKWDDHYFFTGYLITQNEPITSIGVHNNCLVDHIPNHANIFHFQYGQQKRTYKLDLGRQQTEVKF